MGRFVCVYGPSGSGKTTLSRELGARLGLPVVELDAIFHSRPGWNDLSREEFREAVASVLAEHPGGWVIEGNYSHVRDLILPLATDVVWLRLPWRTVYPRLVKRTVGRRRRRELLWGTNYEPSFRQMLRPHDDNILWWGIRHWKPHHRNTAAALREHGGGARLRELRSAAAVARFVAGVRPAASPVPS